LRAGVEGEGAADDGFGIRGEVEGGEFLRGEPARVEGVPGGVEFAGSGTTEKVDQYVVVLDAAGRVVQDAIEHAKQFAGFDIQSSFFFGLAHGSLAQGLSNFEYAAGYGPLPCQGLVAALYEDGLSSGNDDGADTDERRGGVFAGH
jgi:hypothetical protein